MIELKRGDVACVSSDALHAKLIQTYTKLHSPDNKSTTNHSLIITGAAGTTFEALWTAREAHMDRYKNKKVIIYRPIETIAGDVVSKIAINNAIERVMKEHKGDWYPVHRLFLYLILPTLMKYLTTGKVLMCSETVAKYEDFINVYGGEYGGVVPDALVDRWHIARTHELVYKGIW